MLRPWIFFSKTSKFLFNFFQNEFDIWKKKQGIVKVLISYQIQKTAMFFLWNILKMQCETFLKNYQNFEFFSKNSITMHPRIKKVLQLPYNISVPNFRALGPIIKNFFSKSTQSPQFYTQCYHGIKISINSWKISLRWSSWEENKSEMNCQLLRKNVNYLKKKSI